MKKIAFLFSPRGTFAHNRASPIVRWVFEVLNRSNKDEISIDVLAKKVNTVDTMNVNLKANKRSHFYFLIIKLLPNSLSTIILPRLWCLGFRKYVRNYDVLIVENRLFYAPLIRRMGYKGILIVHLHNDLLKDRKTEYLSKINESVDHLIVCSNVIAKPLSSLCPMLFDKTTTIYNGVDQKLFSPNKGSEKHVTLLFIGRIVNQKGVHLLLQAYEQLLNHYPEIQLKIAGRATFGGGKKLSKYEMGIKEKVLAINSIHPVELLGFLEHDTELPNIFLENTILCVPSLGSEAFPMVVVEAMMSGKAVVASNFGGIREALGSDEFLVEPGNVEQLTERIGFLIEHPEKRKQVEKQNLARARTFFTWDKIAQDFQAFIKDIS